MHPVHYTLIGVMVISAVVYALPKVKAFLRNFGPGFRENKNANLAKEKQWAILTGAILSESNNQYCNSLNTGTDRVDVVTRLREWWGITNTQDAIESLTWLRSEGHRTKYTIVTSIMRSPQSQWQEKAAAIDSSGALYESVTNLMEGITRLKKDNLLTVDDFNSLGILSWDLGRLINNCRWCYEANYITEDQAWSYIMPAARELQNAYNSWEELAKGYLLGRAMWDGVGSGFDLIVYSAKELLSDEKSPWKKMPWATPLATITSTH